MDGDANYFGGSNMEVAAALLPLEHPVMHFSSVRVAVKVPRGLRRLSVQSGRVAHAVLETSASNVIFFLFAHGCSSYFQAASIIQTPFLVGVMCSLIRA